MSPDLSHLFAPVLLEVGWCKVKAVAPLTPGRVGVEKHLLHGAPWSRQLRLPHSDMCKTVNVCLKTDVK